MKTKFKLGEDFTICDMCRNYNVSNCGTRETCDAIFEGSRMIINMPKDYVNERMNGNKTTCKEFKRDFSAKEIKERLQ